jgi:hypothetical protein
MVLIEIKSPPAKRTQRQKSVEGEPKRKLNL